MIALPKLMAFAGALAVAALLLWIVNAHRPRPRHPRRGQGEAGRAS